MFEVLSKSMANKFYSRRVRSYLQCLSPSWILRNALTFRFNLQKSVKEFNEMTKLVYGNVLSLKTVYKWCQGFKSGNKSGEGGKQSGHPLTSTEMETCKCSNRCLTIQELS